MKWGPSILESRKPEPQGVRGQRLHLGGLVPHGKLPVPRPTAWGGVP